eukprot:6190470-Pleurochrysis_carterae.AAC.1
MQADREARAGAQQVSAKAAAGDEARAQGQDGAGRRGRQLPTYPNTELSIPTYLLTCIPDTCILAGHCTWTTRLPVFIRLPTKPYPDSVTD